MSLSNSRHSYTDCYEVLERALEDPAGIRMRIKDLASAETFRARLHYARKLKQKDTERIYEPDSPLHGITPYDALVCRIKTIDGQTYIYIEHRQTPTEIQSLAEVEEHGQVEGPHMDGRGLIDDLAQSVVSGDRDQGGDNSGPEGSDERPVHVPQITRRL